MGSDGWKMLKIRLHKCLGRMCFWLPILAGRTPLVN